MSAIATFESAVESRLWIMLHLQTVEKAKAKAMESATLEKLKPFCQELSASKLRYFSQDRQEPGVFDMGAGLLIEWADEVLEVLGDSSDPALARVENGIRAHRVELAEHLETPLEQREVIQ